MSKDETTPSHAPRKCDNAHLPHANGGTDHGPVAFVRGGKLLCSACTYEKFGTLLPLGERPKETDAEICAGTTPSTTPQKLSEPHEPPMVYDPMQGMVRPGGIRALMNDLRKLYDKTAEAHDGDYPEKVDHGLVAVYAYGRRQTTPSATPRIPDVLFDGHAVFLEANRAAGPEHSLKSHHVSAVLDAVVRLLRAADGGKQTKSNDS